MENNDEHKYEKKFANKYQEYYYSQKNFTANCTFFVNVFLLIVLFSLAINIESASIRTCVNIIAISSLFLSVITFLFLKLCIQVKDDTIRNLKNKIKKLKEDNKDTIKTQQKESQ